MLVDFLQRGEDQFLTFFEIVVFEVREQFADDIEIDFLPSGKRGRNGEHGMSCIGVSHSAILPVAVARQSGRGAATVCARESFICGGKYSSVGMVIRKKMVKGDDVVCGNDAGVDPYEEEPDRIGDCRVMRSSPLDISGRVT